jgi:hypothetical protein
MPQWRNTDDAANSVVWGPALVKAAVNSDNRSNLYANTTSGAFIPGQKTGVVGVSVAEAAVSGGPIVAVTITSPGSGYHANASVTVSGDGSDGAANAQANSTGRISAINVTNSGSGYETAQLTIAAPAAQTFNAGAVAANGFIPITANKFQVADYVTYAVAAGNTVLDELTSGSQYYVQASNATGVYLSATLGGAALTLTVGENESGHSLQGQTATAVASVGGGRSKGATPGWNLRKEGTGGRAGRVHYECLVAMGSIAGGADSDDTLLPDS